jgi:hypothetical protein
VKDVLYNKTDCSAAKKVCSPTKPREVGENYGKPKNYRGRSWGFWGIPRKSLGNKRKKRIEKNQKDKIEEEICV